MDHFGKFLLNFLPHVKISVKNEWFKSRTEIRDSAVKIPKWWNVKKNKLGTESSKVEVNRFIYVIHMAAFDFRGSYPEI